MGERGRMEKQTTFSTREEECGFLTTSCSTVVSASCLQSVNQHEGGALRQYCQQ